MYHRYIQGGELRGAEWSVDAINVFSDELLTRLEKLISHQLSDLYAIIIAFGMPIKFNITIINLNSIYHEN